MTLKQKIYSHMKRKSVVTEIDVPAIREVILEDAGFYEMRQVLEDVVGWSSIISNYVVIDDENLLSGWLVDMGNVEKVLNKTEGKEQ